MEEICVKARLSISLISRESRDNRSKKWGNEDDDKRRRVVAITSHLNNFLQLNDSLAPEPGSGAARELIEILGSPKSPR